MASALKKSTGREVWAMLLDDSVTLVGDGSTVKTVANHLYCIVAIATGSSVLPTGLGVGDCFFSMSALTLAEGDKVIELGDIFDTDKLIGYARSKDISRTKSTVDMTVDGDLSDTGDIRVDPIVSVSGNINGYKVNGLPATSASRKIDAKFAKQIIEADDGTVTTMEKNDDVSLIALIYIKTLRDNQCDVDIVPCHFTSNGDSTDYGSATSKSVAFTGCASSDNGVLPQSITATFPNT